MSVLQEEIRLETDEITRVFGQIFGDVLDRVVLHEGVGVVFRRQHHDADVHTFFENHVGATECGVDAGSVTVVEHGDVLCVAAYHADLLGSQRRAGACHHVFDACLMH